MIGMLGLRHVYLTYCPKPANPPTNSTILLPVTGRDHARPQVCSYSLDRRGSYKYMGSQLDDRHNESGVNVSVLESPLISLSTRWSMFAHG